MRKRKIIIFLISMLATLVFLFVSSGIHRAILHKRMVKYAKASARKTDGAENCVIMDGKSGFIGASHVYVKYLEDGYMKIFGDNTDDSSEWKLVSEWTMDEGRYTLSGLSGFEEKTLELQLSVWNEERDEYDYYCQFDDEVSFEIIEKEKVRLFLRVYPEVTGIDAIARPAVYKDA